MQWTRGGEHDFGDVFAVRETYKPWQLKPDFNHQQEDFPSEHADYLSGKSWGLTID